VLPPPVGDPTPEVPTLTPVPPVDHPCGWRPPVEPEPEEPGEPVVPHGPTDLVQPTERPEEPGPTAETTRPDQPPAPQGGTGGPGTGELAYTGVRANVAAAAGIVLMVAGVFTLLIARLLHRRLR
jgi:hypothetical protein